VGQRRLASALVEAGANAVIGHGSHTRQVVEEDGDSLVLFGLGNLVFDDVSAVGHPEPPVVLNCARTEEGWRVRPR
jgi:poly-gamma-glutamate capsule biosynthesis protein CapA/YwtB (metallophosphatase superfamily)